MAKKGKKNSKSKTQKSQMASFRPVSAPATKGDVVSAGGSQYSFSAAPPAYAGGPPGLRVNYRYRGCAIGYSAETLRTVVAFPGVAAANTNVCSVLNLSYGSYGPPAWLRNMAATFDRQRFNHVHYRYVPVVGSSKNGRVVLGFHEDYNTYLTSPLTEVSALVYAENGAVSVSTPVWSEAMMKVVPTNRLVDSYWGATTVAANNSSSLGGFLVVSVTATTDTGVTFYGDLWVEGSVDLFGLDGARVGYAPTLAEEKKEADKDDLVRVPPPTPILRVSQQDPAGAPPAPAAVAKAAWFGR